MEELRRIRLWYRSFAADDTELVMAVDIALDNKLRAMRNDILDRAEAEAMAQRFGSSTKQYTGPERRMRRVQRARITRAVVPAAPKREPVYITH